MNIGVCVGGGGGGGGEGLTYLRKSDDLEKKKNTLNILPY